MEGNTASNQIKVLHILASDSFSGAENVVCQIIALFRDSDRFKMAYCSPDGPVREALSRKGVRFLPVESMRLNELKRVIHSFHPDIIHSHDVRASVMAAMCHGKARLICTIHSNDPKMRLCTFKSVSSLLFAKEAEHVFWVSGSSMDGFVFRKYVKAKSSVLRNVIDGEEIRKKASQDPNEYSYDGVFIGRLTQQKRPERLVEVLKRAAAALPSLRFAVIGNGELEAQVREMTVAENLGKNVDMLGYMANPMKVLSCAKALLLTSQWEGTPMVVLEALSLGVPVISTPVDGVAEVVTDGLNGFLSEDVEVLAEKLVRCIRDPQLESRLSIHAAESFSQENDLQAFRDCLERYYSGNDLRDI